MKFILLVEGEAEKLAIAEFLKRWLDPQLKQPVGIKVVNFHGNARKQLFGKLAPEVVAGKCPYLRLMLGNMLAMAKAAGL